MFQGKVEGVGTKGECGVKDGGNQSVKWESTDVYSTTKNETSIRGNGL